MKTFLKKLLGKGRSFSRRMDEYQESITFAEAGESAPGPSETPEPAEEKPGVLLVIGNGSRFSRRVIDYSLEMAQRMSYPLVALNVAPLPNETARLFSPPKGKIQEFEEKSRENAREFEEAAAAAGISFTHTVKFGETDEAIHEAGREYGPVEFVISEPGGEEAAARPENENRAEKQVYVYSMV